MVNLNNLPLELKEKGYFCCWQYEERDGAKPSKVPYNPRTGGRAMSNMPETFANYGIALSVINHYDGLGIGLFGDIAAIDIDDCCDGNVPNEMAKDIINIMDTYTERSPSGTGVRILFKAPGFMYDKLKYYINNRRIGLEIYLAGATNKFVTITGDAINKKEMCERDDKLQVLLDKYMKRPDRIPNRKTQESDSLLTDEAVLEKAFAAKNSEAFKLLWNGNTSGYASHSEADLAFCGMLAFWCRRDVDQMDRLYRNSRLFRYKWDQPRSGSTYGQLTLKKAAESTREVYSPEDANWNSNKVIINYIVQKIKEIKPECNPLYAWTDIGNGRLFADCFKDYARYVPERSSWFAYNGKVWRHDIEGMLTAEMCKMLADQIMIYALSINDEHLRNDYIKHVSKWQSHRNRDVILRDAKSVYPVKLQDFDTDPFIFNCLNGTLNLKTREFKEHSSKDMLTKISYTIYDLEKVCSRWNQFISEVTSNDRETAEYIQKSFGYALTGDTSRECLFVIYGSSSRNGKGTLVESVMGTVGDYGRTANPETLGMKSNPNSGAPSEDIARLAGVRFCNISEPDRKLMLSAALVKRLTGNDTITARFLHENSFEFKPKFKIFMNTNHLPHITDMTLFTSGRIKIIPFDRHFEEDEQDKTLKSEFVKPENQSAILNWLIEGFKLFEKEGLEMPDSVKRATEDYRHESDKVRLFVEDEMRKDPDEEERTSVAYARYQQWCEENGHHPENMPNFKQALIRIADIVRKRPRDGGSQTTMVVGYKLLPKRASFLGQNDYHDIVAGCRRLNS